MTQTTEVKWLRISTGFLLVGAVAWLFKFAAIAATENIDNPLAGPLWIIGFFAMLLGAAGIGVWLTWRWHTAVRIIGGLLGAAIFFMSMNIIDTAAKSAVADNGPLYVQEEWGILVAAVVWLCVGLGADAVYRSSVAGSAASESR